MKKIAQGDHDDAQKINFFLHVFQESRFRTIVFPPLKEDKERGTT